MPGAGLYWSKARAMNPMILLGLTLRLLVKNATWRSQGELRHYSISALSSFLKGYNVEGPELCRPPPLPVPLKTSRGDVLGK